MCGRGAARAFQNLERTAADDSVNTTFDEGKWTHVRSPGLRRGRTRDGKQRNDEERERERLDQEGVVDDVEGARVGAGRRQRSVYGG